MKAKLEILYERLSHDDELQGESNSITNQKKLLEDYAMKNGFTNTAHFSDDGWSGTRWDRPEFLKVMDEIESGNVAVLIVKDMSRLGRDYLRVGLLMEKLREKNVRLIAINDNLDTAKGEDDFIPFRNIIHEWYVRDTSRKVKSAFRTRGMAGIPTNHTPPYGYQKSPEDKHKWVVDPEAAAVVRRIFQLTMDGKGLYQICCILEADRVKTPGAYLADKGIGLHKSHVFENPYKWHSGTVGGILKKKEYLGHTVNFKSTKNSYKEKRNHYVPESEWVVFEDTHEAIIDQETFDNVQRIRGNVKRRPDGWGYVHPLTGLVYCADCGAKLYVHRIYNGKDMPMYVCGNSTKADNRQCTGHRIGAAKLMSLVAETLKQISRFAKEDEAAFSQKVSEALSNRQKDEIKAQRKQLAKLRKRAAELETLYRKIYEDNALGKLSDKRFTSLSAEYETEQEQIEREIPPLQAAVDRFEDGNERAGQFTELVKRYRNFDEMTVSMLNEFVERIVVHERDRKGSIDTTQKVDIYLNFIGRFDLAQAETAPLTPEQIEERRKIEERKDRLHQNYLKRKANGKQREWEERYNAKRRARAAERKAALLAQGIGANAATPYTSTAL